MHLIFSSSLTDGATPAAVTGAAADEVSAALLVVFLGIGSGSWMKVDKGPGFLDLSPWQVCVEFFFPAPSAWFFFGIGKVTRFMNLSAITRRQSNNWQKSHHLQSTFDPPFKSRDSYLRESELKCPGETKSAKGEILTSRNVGFDVSCKNVTGYRSKHANHVKMTTILQIMLVSC